MDHSNQDKSAQFGGFFLICSFLTFVLLLTLLINHTLNKTPAPIILTQGTDRTLVLTRSADQHFHIVGKLDGQSLDLLIDTGASYLTISQDFARQLNLQTSTHITTQTANGQSDGLVASVRSLDLNGIILQDIKVVIMANLTSDIGLLGVNVLQYFAITQDANKMSLTLTQPKTNQE